MKNKVHEAKEQLTEVKKTKAYVVKEGTITATIIKSKTVYLGWY